MRCQVKPNRSQRRRLHPRRQPCRSRYHSPHPCFPASAHGESSEDLHSIAVKTSSNYKEPCKLFKTAEPCPQAGTIPQAKSTTKPGNKEWAGCISEGQRKLTHPACNLGSSREPERKDTRIPTTIAAAQYLTYSHVAAASANYSTRNVRRDPEERDSLLHDVGREGNQAPREQQHFPALAGKEPNQPPSSIPEEHGVQLHT